MSSDSRNGSLVHSQNPAKPRGSSGSGLRRFRAEFECLECRSMLSTTLLGGFPSGGFQEKTLEGESPWGVSILVAGEPTIATGYAESREQLAEAPSLLLTGDEFTWIAGIIGDSLLQRLSATNDVDLYRIELPAGQHYAVSLNVLSHSFGSALDPAVALYDSSGRLMAFNDDTLMAPYPSESRLELGLDGGVYFVAVAAGGNLGGESGFFPAIPGSANDSRGTSGPYLLKITALPDSTEPEVLSVFPDPGTVWHDAVSEIKVRFSEAMDLLGLAQGATLVRSDGLEIGLRAIAYDSAACEVTYLLIDAPAAGDYVFGLDASRVTDRAGNPISGTAPDGDFVLQLSIDPPVLPQVDQEPNNFPSLAQNLGPLYVRELRPGVQVDGTVAVGGADQDYYRFEVTRAGFFSFRLEPGARASSTGLLRLHDAMGMQLAQGFRFPGMGSVLYRFLKPGEYIIQMDGAVGVPGESYVLRIQAASEPEIPLVDQNLNPVSVSAVLNTLDGRRPQESDQAQPDATPVVVTSSESTVQSVSSLPAIGSQPVGRAMPESASSRVLAWAGAGSSTDLLPPGFRLGEPDLPILKFPVDRVGSSFHDPLPDTIGSAVDAPVFSQQSIQELVALLCEPGAGAAIAAEPAAGPTDTGPTLPEHAARETAEVVRAVTGSPSFAFGMIASIGAASALTVPNRRQQANWIQRAFHWLGWE